MKKSITGRVHEAQPNYQQFFREDAKPHPFDAAIEALMHGGLSRAEATRTALQHLQIALWERK